MLIECDVHGMAGMPLSMRSMAYKELAFALCMQPVLHRGQEVHANGMAGAIVLMGCVYLTQVLHAAPICSHGCVA